MNFRLVNDLVLSENSRNGRGGKGGAQFENTLVTTSLCSPSRASILTGQYLSKQTTFTSPNIFEGSDTKLRAYREYFGWPRKGFDKWVSFGVRVFTMIQNSISTERRAQKEFRNSKADTLPQYCRACDCGFACNGECPNHRFIETPDGEYGLNYLCAGYKKFFSHIDRHIKFMANELRHERPPANVMAWSRKDPV